MYPGTSLCGGCEPILVFYFGPNKALGLKLAQSQRQ